MEPDPQNANTIEATQDLLAKATKLKESAARGEYTQADLREFWEVCQNAGLILRVSNTELAEIAGLGGSYFSSVARERRRPKLVNFLRALTAVIHVANDRLGHFGLDNQKAIWLKNPARRADELRESLEHRLEELIKLLKSSNSLSQIVEIDLAHRNHLIELLETTLVLLKAPLIEKTLIAEAGGQLRKLAAKVSDHAGAGFIGGLAGAAATALLQLIS